MITINLLWICLIIWVLVANIGAVLDAWENDDFAITMSYLFILWLCWAGFDFGVFLYHHITITF